MTLVFRANEDEICRTVDVERCKVMLNGRGNTTKGRIRGPNMTAGPAESRAQGRTVSRRLAICPPFNGWDTAAFGRQRQALEAQSVYNLSAEQAPTILSSDEKLRRGVGKCQAIHNHQMLELQSMAVFPRSNLARD